MHPRRRAPALVAGGGLALGLLLAACGSSGDAAGPGAPSRSTSSTSAPGGAPDTTTPASSTSSITSSPTSTSGARPTPTTSARGSARRDLAGLVIVVDPGHNGANGAHPAETGRLVDAGGFRKPCNTTGASDSGYDEHEFTWATAQVVRDALQARGARVVLTRTSDDGWGPCVDQRGLTAQRAGADAIVSIHADGAAPSAHGFHVIHALAGPTVAPAVAERSTTLAADVRDALVAGGWTPATYVGGGTGTVARTDIATLNRAGVPGVMLESGNLHAPGDLARLRSPAGQRSLADAIADALANARAAGTIG